MQTSTFNSKVTEVENEIKAADIIPKSANTKVNNIRSHLIAYATSQLNDASDEVTGIDNKTKKMPVIF